MFLCLYFYAYTHLICRYMYVKALCVCLCVRGRVYRIISVSSLIPLPALTLLNNTLSFAGNPSIHLHQSFYLFLRPSLSISLSLFNLPTPQHGGKETQREMILSFSTFFLFNQAYIQPQNSTITHPSHASNTHTHTFTGQAVQIHRFCHDRKKQIQFYITRNSCECHTQKM